MVGGVLSRGKGEKTAFQPGRMNIRAAGRNGNPVPPHATCWWKQLSGQLWYV